MFQIKVNGLKEFNNRIKTIISKMPNSIEKGIVESMKNISDYAILQAPEISGTLKSSIKYEIIDVKKNEVKGRVYSDINIAPYALWVNYGTGIYAEGEGGSRAKKIPWFVHSDMADLSQYHFQTWTAPSGDVFYIVYGQRATHFFDSSEFATRDKNVKAIIQEIKSLIGG